jgi:hypothetical protein
MYDYLAKIILLGPSGTGKYVTPQYSRGTSDRPRIYDDGKQLWSHT